MPSRVANPCRATLLRRESRERIRLGIRVGKGNRVTLVVRQMVERLRRLRRAA